MTYLEYLPCFDLMDTNTLAIHHSLHFMSLQRSSEANTPPHCSVRRGLHDWVPEAPKLSSMQPTWHRDGSYTQRTLHEYARIVMELPKDREEANAKIILNSTTNKRPVVTVTPYHLCIGGIGTGGTSLAPRALSPWLSLTLKERIEIEAKFTVLQQLFLIHFSLYL